MPEQRQLRQSGVEKLMVPRAIIENSNYKGSGKLEGKVALITGGDSGMGAAVLYLKPDSSIINTTSVVAYYGNEQLIDYSATKAANVL